MLKALILDIIERMTMVGITDDLDFYDQLKFKAFNQSIACILLATLIMIVSDIFEKNETLLYSVMAFLLTFSIMVLTSYRQQFIAGILFTTLYPFLLFILTILYGEGLNISYTYFAFIIIILLFFKNRWLKIALSLFIFTMQVAGIYYNRYYGSIIIKDVPLLDGMLILILPIIGVGYLVLGQVNAIKGLYDQQKVINNKLQMQNVELTTLVKQNESQNDLLAIIAHDLKGPATSFNNLTKNIAYLIKKEQPEKLEQMAHSFEHAGNKLYYTISNLLNWVTAQRGTIVSENKSFDFKVLLAEVIDNLGAQIQLKKVTVNFPSKDLPELSTDRNILKIILFNLLNNAIKFSKENEDINVDFSRNSGYDVIEIIDYGDGIEEEVIQKIQRQEIISVPGTHQEKGHGIGLKICFALIQHLEGTLKIDTELGKGSVFKISVPRGKDF